MSTWETVELPHRALIGTTLPAGSSVDRLHWPAGLLASASAARTAHSCIVMELGSTRLLPTERGFPFLFERTNPLLIIMAVVNYATQTLYPLEPLRRHGVPAG